MTPIRNTAALWRRRLMWLDHLAVWIGLYAGAALVAADLLLGRPVEVPALVAAV